MVIVREIRSPENKPQEIKTVYKMKAWSNGQDLDKTYHILFFSFLSLSLSLFFCFGSLFLPLTDLYANKEPARSLPHAQFGNGRRTILMHCRVPTIRRRTAEKQRGRETLQLSKHGLKLEKETTDEKTSNPNNSRG